MTQTLDPALGAQPSSHPVSAAQAPDRLDIHMAVLANFITPHILPVYEALAERVGRLTVLVSTPMEQNRHWQPDFGRLNVRVQRTRTLLSQWRHPVGFKDPVEIHLPWDTISQLRELRPDVVVSWQLGARSLLSTLYARGRHRPALVISTGLSEHTERGISVARRVLRKWLLRRADAVLVNGHSGARYLRSLGVPPDKLFLAPYTAEPAALYRGGITRDPAAAHRLLFVGQLIERKGILPFTELLARWAAARPGQRVDFTIVGSGPLSQRLGSMPKPANLTVRLLGQCSFQQVADCYGTCGLFAFPTLADEWGMVVNEALYAGLPVLGSRYAQSVEELCLDGQTGWTYRTDVPGEVEAALSQAFARTPEELNEMRRAARERVAGITPERGAERMLEAVRSALRRVRGR